MRALLTKALKPFNFKKLMEAGMELSWMYLLELSLLDYDVNVFATGKLLNVLQTLIRRQLITKEGKITEEGKHVLEEMEEEGRGHVKKRAVEKGTKFKEWWNVFPISDAFEYKGKTFQGIRRMKTAEMNCEIQFNKLINEGMNADDVINATITHIEQAKSLSYKRGANQLTFIPSSERYLREKCFEPYIGSGKKREEETSNDTFI
jgi:hypothetical protein